MAMADFDKSLPRVLKWEGGYSNDPNDPGGETNYGITIGAARDAGYTGPMKNIPFDTVKSIYKKRYWDALNLDYVIDQPIADQIFQAAVNQGVPLWRRYIQRACNKLLDIDHQLQESELITNQVIDSINYLIADIGKKVLLSMAIYGLQEARYDEIVQKNPKMQWARNGWKNRSKAFLIIGT